MKFKLFIISASLLAFIFTGTVHAESNQYLAEKISNTSAKEYKDSDIFTYKQTLRRGVRNDDVKLLQEKLQKLGYYSKSIDGDYGSGTHAAVIKYQQSRGLKADGIAGPQTYARILDIDYSIEEKNKVKDEFIACTQEYNPVCGQHEINCITTPCIQPEPKTFGNKCSLRSTGAKYLYSGECKKEKEEDYEDRPCTKEYNPVCAYTKVKDGNTYSAQKNTYSNKCLMYNAEAEFKHFGKCDGEEKSSPVKSEYSEKEREEKIKYIQQKIEELQKQLKELG
jgi:N-acetylmuramoyl-L-alanine amidase